MTDQRALLNRLPRSCIRNQSQENLLKRTKIVLALPSYNRQRLSGIRRGWCPSQSQRTKRVIRSDSGVTHRLSLSARVVSAVDSQVKTKRQGKKRLWRLQNRRAHGFQSVPKSRPWWAESNESCEPAQHALPLAFMQTAQISRNLNIIRVIYRCVRPTEAMPCPVSWAVAPNAGYAADPASCVDADSQAAGRLQFYRQAIFRGRCRRAYPPWFGGRPTNGP